MLAHDNLVQAEKTLQNALVALGKANSFMSHAISLETSTTTHVDTASTTWGTSGTSGVWGSGGSSGYAFGGVEGYVAMAMNSVNLALAALNYYPEQP